MTNFAATLIFMGCFVRGAVADKGRYDDKINQNTPFAVPDETIPLQNPNKKHGGWYFKKTSSDSASKKFNYYFFADLGSSVPVPEPIFEQSFTYGELTSIWAVVYFYEAPTNNAPYFTIYTKPTGLHWHDWRLNFVLNVATVPLLGKVFLWAGSSGDPGVHPEVEARLQLSTTLQAFQGTFTGAGGPAAADEMLFLSIQTATNQAPPVEMAIEGVGYTTSAVDSDGEPLIGDMELIFKSGKGKSGKSGKGRRNLYF